MGQSNADEKIEEVEDDKSSQIQNEKLEVDNEIIAETTTDEVSPIVPEPRRLVLIKNKILDFLLSLNTRIETFLKSPFGKFIIITIIFLFIAVPIILTVLGFDNIFIKTSIKGIVKDTNGAVVPEAELKLQGETIHSNENGEYEFKEVDYGRWQIEIRADGYEDYNEQLTIERFSNNKDFELVPLDFGELNGSFTNKNINLDQFHLTINDQEIFITEEGKFNTGRLITGKYNLKLTSPYYKDFDLEVEIKSGNKALEPITLESAGDIIGSVYDYLGQTEISDAEILIKGTDETLETVDDGFLVKDINIGSEVQLSFSKENYKKKIITLKVEAGENSLDKVLLVPNGKIITGNGTKIVVSDYDGENQIPLSANIANCIFLFSSNTTVATRCGSTIYRSHISSGAAEVIGTVTPPSNITNNFRIVTVNNTGSSTITLDGTNIFTSDLEDVVSWVDDNTVSNLYISTTSGIYKKNLNDSSEATKFADGIFILNDINPSQNSLIALNQANSAGSLFNIWTISTDGNKTRKTIFPKAYSNLRWVDDSTIIYTVSENGVNNLYKMEVASGKETKLKDNIASYIYNSDLKLITTSLSGERYILNIEGHSYKM